jgi:hypothetical protein
MMCQLMLWLADGQTKPDGCASVVIPGVVAWIMLLILGGLLKKR